MEVREGPTAGDPVGLSDGLGSVLGSPGQLVEDQDRQDLVDECALKGYKQVSISGRELREKLRTGELPNPRVMRPETARILIERMRAQ